MAVYRFFLPFKDIYEYLYALKLCGKHLAITWNKLATFKNMDLGLVLGK